MKHTEALRVSSLCKLARALGPAVILLSFSAPPTMSADSGVPFPNGFRDWFVVNSMSATKDSPVFGGVDGLHPSIKGL